MGITVHFEGKLKGGEAFQSALSSAIHFCEEHGWPYERIDHQNATLKRVRDEQDWDYEGPVQGIQIQPHENSEPIRLEFDRDLYIQDYTKTQFAPVDIHVLIVELLQRLRPYFAHLEVVDEGEFFETGNLDTLKNHINRCFEVLDEYFVQSEKYYGPIRLENKRMVDVMSRD